MYAIGADGGAGTGEVHFVDAGQSGGCQRGIIARVFLLRHFGEAEIEDLGVAALGDENIRGLDVAMHDAFGVRGVERVGDFDGEIEQRIRYPRAGRRCGA